MKIAIVGGGASGMFCALQFKNCNANVTVFEKNNETLKKLLITGNGRCNVTNLVEPEEFLENIAHNSKFMFASLNKFNSFDTVNFLKDNGVEICLQDNSRVFPATNKALTIKNCLDNALPKNVVVKIGCEVKNILKVKDKFKVFYNSAVECFDAVVIATGGLSFPNTGSTGDGYKFASNFNINVKPQRSALCALKLANVPKNFEGTPFNCKVGLLHNKKSISLLGEGLFTGFGVSGPVIHKLSSIVQEQNIENSLLTFDLLKDKTLDECINDFRQYIISNPKRYVVHLINNFVNIKFAKDVLQKLNLPENLQCANVSKQNLLNIINMLKNYRFEVKGFGDILGATITRGGIDCKEINPATMESKKIENLYFIGEVLDVDAFSGGFNLQIAFSSAYACAINLIKKKMGN